jgi:LCP family protein required for cell wall assembly
VIRRHPVLATIVIVPTVLALSLATLVALWIAGVRIPGASAARWFTITKTANADYTPAPDQPVFFLAIGNDGRPGDTVTRGDAIHLIGVNPKTRQATMLDIPRDTGMEIPGHGLDKVNASHTYGGARLEADTIGAVVGIKIPYVIDTNFDGFIGMVNDMGGLQVAVPYAMKDSYSGADFAPGLQKLSGQQALAYARNRHQFPDSDLTRTQNQGYLILQALTQLREENTGPLHTLDLLADLARHAELDGVGLKDLYALARLGLSINPDTMKNVLVPVTSGTGSRLQLGPGAASLFADFRDDAMLENH